MITQRLNSIYKKALATHTHTAACRVIHAAAAHKRSINKFNRSATVAYWSIEISWIWALKQFINHLETSRMPLIIANIEASWQSLKWFLFIQVTVFLEKNVLMILQNSFTRNEHFHFPCRTPLRDRWLCGLQYVKPSGCGWCAQRRDKQRPVDAPPSCRACNSSLTDIALCLWRWWHLEFMRSFQCSDETVSPALQTHYPILLN